VTPNPDFKGHCILTSRIPRVSKPYRIFVLGTKLDPRHTGGAVPLRCYCGACTA